MGSILSANTNSDSDSDSIDTGIHTLKCRGPAWILTCAHHSFFIASYSTDMMTLISKIEIIAEAYPSTSDMRLHQGRWRQSCGYQIWCHWSPKIMNETLFGPLTVGQVQVPLRTPCQWLYPERANNFPMYLPHSEATAAHSTPWPAQVEYSNSSHQIYSQNNGQRKEAKGGQSPVGFLLGVSISLSRSLGQLVQRSGSCLCSAGNQFGAGRSQWEGFLVWDRIHNCKNSHYSHLRCSVGSVWSEDISTMRFGLICLRRCSLQHRSEYRLATFRPRCKCVGCWNPGISCLC